MFTKSYRQSQSIAYLQSLSNRIVRAAK